MLSTPKISIVIAMYNIEKYIVNCLESCLNQNGVNEDEYEIVVVDDGSTDGSYALAEEAIRGHNNSRIITKKNGGLSSARNAGIDVVRGEYVWFVDGDDAIAPNAIEVLVGRIAESHCDAYIHNFSTFEDKELIATSNFVGYEQVLSGKEIHNRYQRIMPMMAWLTVYKSALLKEKLLRFREGIIHEDMEFSIRGHHKAESIMFVREALYYYRVARKDSIMSSAQKDNTRSLVSMIEIIQSFEEFFCAEDGLFARKVIGVCATLFVIRRYDDAFVLNDSTRKLVKNNKWRIYRSMWRSKQWKRRALLIFVLLMPKVIVGKVLFKLGERSKLM